MAKSRNIKTFKTSWSGIAIELRFDRGWPGGEKLATAHLEVRTVPERQPLPITESGYRSHFCHPRLIDEAGGPVAFVLAWIEAEARTQKWKAAEFSRRQLSLF